MADQQETSLAAAMNDAAAEVDNAPERDTEFHITKPDAPKDEKIVKATGRREQKTVPSDITAPGAPAPEAPKPWEAPGWAKMWKENRRAALEKIATHPELAGDAKEIVEELNNTYGYIGRAQQERAQIEKRFGPIADTLGQMEHAATMSGRSLQQDLGQMHAVAQSLARNPDETLPWLGTLYKPSNPAKVIQALSQAWGADLGQLAQSAPYVDPAIAQLVQPLLNRVQSTEQALYQQQQQAVQAQQRQVLQSVQAFENAKDEKGNPKYPYFQDVLDGMIYAANSGKVQGVEQAYNWAVQFHPAAMADKAREAEQVALGNASRTTAVAKQASVASRNVSGASRGQDFQPATREDAMRMAAKQLGMT